MIKKYIGHCGAAFLYSILFYSSHIWRQRGPRKPLATEVQKKSLLSVFLHHLSLNGINFIIIDKSNSRRFTTTSIDSFCPFYTKLSVCQLCQEIPSLYYIVLQSVDVKFSLKSHLFFIPCHRADVSKMMEGKTECLYYPSIMLQNFHCHCF